MKAQDYIMSTVEALAQPIAREDIGKQNLEDAIYAKVMSKKFRKLKPGDNAVSITKNAIKLSVKEGKPIMITEMFGGNKLWRFEEAPEIDWAELFSFTYFMQWMRSIASVYEPGAHFDYFSQDISAEQLNNVPRAETDHYSETFRAMLEWAQPHLPPNIQVTYRRHFDLFDNPDDYYKELEEAEARILKKNNGQLPQLNDVMRAATELNVKLRPGQDNDPSWREKVELQHQAIFATKTLQPYMTNPHQIRACPTYFSKAVVTGSTKRSYAKFWAGVGALQRDSDTFHELVLTPKQLASASFDWEKVHINGLRGKNFSKIRILKKHGLS